jgi:hypothetical protein
VLVESGESISCVLGRLSLLDTVVDEAAERAQTPP